MKWIKTTKEVYWTIYNQHKKDFCVFGTFTNTESSHLGGPEILTEWGFLEADEPLIKSVGKKTDEEKDWAYEYYIAKYERIEP